MTKLSEIVSNNYSLSPSNYNTISDGNAERIKLKDLLDRPLEKSDNGSDVGFSAYLSQSDYYFMRAKSLDSKFYTPMPFGEAVVPMNKKNFQQYNLKKGDILISKDSNIGECVILSRNMPNFMPCGALYRLPLSKNKLYILAMIKSSDFRRQLDKIVPIGATIRHAGKKFLECTIPFPKNNREKAIQNIEKLVAQVVEIEQLIIDKDNEIFNKILNELLNGCKKDIVNLSVKTNLSEIVESARLDAGYYSPMAKKQKAILSNYEYGFHTLEEMGYTIKRGQNLQISNIGKSVYSNTFKEGYYTVIKPTNFSDYGTVESFEYLGNKNQLITLNDGDIVFSGEGTVGKCVLFTDTKEKWITNIHGIVLHKDKANLVESAFVACFLRFLRKWGYYEHFTVGGQGGSLGKNYWDAVIIPNMPFEVKNEIANLYLAKEANINKFKKMGIIQLDKIKKEIESKLSLLIGEITSK